MSDELDTGPSLLSPVRNRRGYLLGRWLIGPLTLFLLVLILIFYVFFTPSVVDGDSMLPTLHDRDRALVTKGYEEPARGDVIVFSLRDERNRSEGLIKRVVGLPGDTVEVRDDLAIVNGVAEEPGRVLADPADPAETAPLVVPEGCVFVLGDNRPIALDSRQFGPIPLSSVRGRVDWIWAPIDRIRRVR